MPQVGYIQLHNSGAFNCNLQYYYVANGQEHFSSGSGKTLHWGDTETADPGQYGVPDGAPIWPDINVVWGDDHDGSINDDVVYVRGTNLVAQYHISGTTTDNHLSLSFGPFKEAELASTAAAQA
jgi:hypothetical protein